MEKRETRTIHINLGLTPSLHRRLKEERDKRAIAYPKISMNDLIIEAVLNQPWFKEGDKK